MAAVPGIALITGAASGIGQATALAFASSGCTGLTLVDLNRKGLDETANEIKKINPNLAVRFAEGSTTDNDFVEKTVAEAVENFGRLDYAVNCAGIIGPWATSTELDLKDHDKVMDVNYRGVFLCARAELRAMLKNPPSGPEDIPGQRGAIVHIASSIGLVARAGARKWKMNFRDCANKATAAYCASKGAVIQLTRADAIDYSESGIRINCICPGLIETPLSTDNGNPEMIKALEPTLAKHPMGRWGKPREVADAAVFLCSSKASYIQGHALAVDGGFLAT